MITVGFHISFILQGCFRSTLVVSCGCSKRQILITCSSNASWSTCMTCLTFSDFRFNVSCASQFCLYICKKLCSDRSTHSFMNSGPHFMLPWRHRCLLLLNYFFVVISTAPMVNKKISLEHNYLMHLQPTVYCLFGSCWFVMLFTYNHKGFFLDCNSTLPFCYCWPLSYFVPFSVLNRANPSFICLNLIVFSLFKFD